MKIRHILRDHLHRGPGTGWLCINHQRQVGTGVGAVVGGVAGNAIFGGPVAPSAAPQRAPSAMWVGEDRDQRRRYRR